jgi:hypothetical protein
VDAYTAPRRRSRREALERLQALQAPVADWETIKRQIVDGAGGAR